jgi:hypothetical protein
MKKQFLCYVIAFLMSCTPLPKKHNETLQANEHNLVDEQNLKWKALNAYVGKYSKDTDLFKNELIKDELKKILDDDYEEYMKFVRSAGYGIEKIDNIICCDVSIMHVGGYNSLILINTEEREVYLFWLNSSVSEKDYKIYGKRPIPEAIKKIIVDDMNTGWGHVARFDFYNDSLLINVINPTAN